ncbi:GntR family transcriptional regulator [Sphaerisporangium sp. NPDC051017]|uniref:GntR family transcriptional regulator n=1 Tax=Sphaerisporangium sp. NPDC051017 TaxID=3154636 RepID=UPI00343B28DF
MRNKADRADGRTSAEPRHVILATTLREAIARGDFSPGERLPPERDLAERFNASRTTVRLALSALKSQGLIGSGHGQGTYVRRPRPIRVMAMDQDRRDRRAENDAATFNAEIARQGGIGRQQIVSVSPVPATGETAKWLAVPEGTMLLARRRVMLVDEEPYQLGDSYYVYELVRDTAIAEMAPVEEGVLSVLEQAHGSPIDHFVDELSFRMPTPEETTALRLAPGVCVVRVIRVAFDAYDRPIEAFDQLMAGDKHVLVYRVPAE